ncbi:MAG TPA: CorA family divalent cation transporter, partial [Mariprofundaceae bacterium]|nr:CorA family divalent cation transporter [Mariprofundaceae bacterium]
EHALNVMQAVQSLLSQRLNDVMKFIAVITVIMTPMGIIAGIFGMNFTHMEILSHPYGFALSIWGMVVMGLGFALYFKMRKWW